MVSFARINPTPLTTYDRLGRTLTSTDQRGVVHTYSYNSAGSPGR
jgi:YD repeat-containing protein